MDSRTRNVCLVLTALCLMSSTHADDSTDAPTDAAKEEGFHLHVRVTERQTNHVELVWDQPEEEVLAYKIHAMKEGSEQVIYSPVLSSASKEHVFENLMVDSHYKICVNTATNDVKQPTGNDEDLVYNEQECVDTTTIPIVRSDSLIVLFCVVGYILLMCLVGYICWYCQKRRLEAAMEEEEEEEAEPEPEEKIAPVPMRPAYAAPPGGPAVRSSIEDHPDIPYITPPVGQLSKKDQAAYHAKV